MKFPRNAKIFRGQFDAGPFAGVFFLLVLFLLLASLVYTPGVRINLPLAEDLPRTDNPTVAVAVDSGGQFYFENQLIQENELRKRLRVAVKNSPEPLTLMVQADRAVKHETLVRLWLLAQDAGVKETLQATLPRVFASPPGAATRP